MQTCILWYMHTTVNPLHIYVIVWVRFIDVYPETPKMVLCDSHYGQIIIFARTAQCLCGPVEASTYTRAAVTSKTLI